MSLKLPPHVHRVKNRHGRDYIYFQRYRGTERAEKPVRLPHDAESPEFWAEYSRLVGLPPPQEDENSFEALVKAWQESPEWEALSPKTREEWSRYCNRIKAAWGKLEVRGIEPKHVLKLRDAYRDRKGAANNLLRCLSSMLAWSVPRGWRSDNPCREVKKFESGDGYEPWPWEIIAAAKGDLRQDLWFAVGLALYTGQREGDVLAMRWSHIRNDRILVKQEKTRKPLAIPIHRDLKELLGAIPKRAVTILTNSKGVPWTKDGFKSTWGKNKPALVAERGLVFRGLRKSAVVTLLEAGCTDAEVSAITGQSRQMVEHYAKQVNQAKLASAAILKWENQNRNETSLGNPIGNPEVGS